MFNTFTNEICFTAKSPPRIIVNTFILSSCKATSPGRFDPNQTKYLSTIKKNAAESVKGASTQPKELASEITTQKLHFQ